MRQGWSGGQYSLFRVVLGLAVARVLATLPLDGNPDPALRRFSAAGLVVLGALLGAALAVGWRDRAAALAGLLLGVALAAALPGAFDLGAICLAWLLVAHAGVPPAPYGSLDGRGRSDPGGGWRMPEEVYLANWGALGLALAGLALAAWAPRWTAEHGIAPALGPGAPWTRILPWLVAAFPFLALFRRLRPLGWIVAVAAAALGAYLALDAGPFLGLTLLLLATFDPGWIPPLEPGPREILFYDGACGLCHRWVRFLVAEDEHGDRFAFAPLGGPTFVERIPAPERAGLPDSLVLLTSRGEPWTRSRAVLRIARRLGGLWRLIAEIVRFVPRPLADLGYDGLARVRGRLFARPADACPVVSQQLLQRFL